MLQSIKKYLQIGAVLFLAIAVVTANVLIKQNQKLKAEIQRVQENNLQLMSSNRQQTNLYLREREVTGQLKIERDSLAKSLKIKPKFIDRIVTIDLSTHDTIEVPVPVVIKGKDEWNFTDSTKCLRISYNAKLIGDSLNVTRTALDNDNSIQQVFYKKRTHKFIISFGKWQYLQKITTKCDAVEYRNIVFEK